MKYITPKHLRKWGACYTDERIAELVPSKGLTVQGYLELDIPNNDKVWLATRPKVLPDYVSYHWAALTVERALGRADNPDPRSVAVIGYLRSRANGGPKDPKIAADAVYAVTYADAADAVYAAATAYATSAELALRVKDLLGLLNADKT